MSQRRIFRNLAVTLIALNPLAWAQASDREPKMPFPAPRCPWSPAAPKAPARMSPWDLLFSSIVYGNSKALKQQLEGCALLGVDVSALRDGMNLRLLHFAVGMVDIDAAKDAVKDLLAAGCSPDHQGGPRLRTPLHSAAERGRLELVKILVEEGKADPRIQDWQGRTALDLARDTQTKPGAGPNPVVPYLQTWMTGAPEGTASAAPAAAPAAPGEDSWDEQPGAAPAAPAAASTTASPGTGPAGLPGPAAPPA